MNMIASYINTRNTDIHKTFRKVIFWEKWISESKTYLNGLKLNVNQIYRFPKEAKISLKNDLAFI